MKFITTFLVMSVFIGMMLLFAQTAAPRVDRREARQQKRTEQGEKNGSLTPREERRLEKREAKIQNDEAAAKSDGKVTLHERRKLNRELNSTSRAIRRQKRDAQRK